MACDLPAHGVEDCKASFDFDLELVHSLGSDERCHCSKVLPGRKPVCRKNAVAPRGREAVAIGDTWGYVSPSIFRARV